MSRYLPTYLLGDLGIVSHEDKSPPLLVSKHAPVNGTSRYGEWGFRLDLRPCHPEEEEEEEEELRGFRISTSSK